MQAPLRVIYFAIVYGLLYFSSNTHADTSAAPYLQILNSSDHQATETLPLKSSAADVEIVGTIARVHLTQCYANSGRVPIEAIYIFPASTRAAVHGMTLTSGGRVIAARIQESVKAKLEYAKAKSEKKTAALLEEHRPNVFQMSVANLLPGDDIIIEIDWTEVIPAVDSTYEFVFPTVVGPRYSGGATGENDRTWAGNPYLGTGTVSPTSLTVKTLLTTTLPLAEVNCPSHSVSVDFKAKNQAVVALQSRSGEAVANRDFILRWKLGNDQVDAGLLLHRDETNHHFLLQVVPPPRVTPDQLPPRDYVMIVDVSGSMSGFPLDTAKVLLKSLVKEFRAVDTFNVVRFASDSGVLSETPLAANEANLALAYEFIDRQTSQGGTELNVALKRSLCLPGGEHVSRSILLITDGLIAADAETIDLVRDSKGRANLFTFGIGTAVNRELLEGVARAGGGEPIIVTAAKEAAGAAVAFHQMVANPVLAKVQISTEGITLGSTEPSPYPDVFASRPLVVTGQWSGEPTGKIIVRGIGGNGVAFEKIIDVAAAAAATGLDHPALPVLWARQRVRSLTDQKRDEGTIREITELGLNYSLLTPYTSFLAVDESPRDFDATVQSVKQPLPLPLGVSESAVVGRAAGIKNASVPEPGSIGLVAFLVVLLALQRQRDLHAHGLS